MNEELLKMGARVIEQLQQLISLDIQNQKSSGSTRARTISLNLITDANTFDFVTTDSPGLGRIWEVLEVSIATNDPFTTPAGSAVVFVGSQVPPNSNTEPVFGRILGIPVNIPNVLEKVFRSALVQRGEHVIVGTKGVTTGTNLTINVSIIDHDINMFFKTEG